MALLRILRHRYEEQSHRRHFAEAAAVENKCCCHEAACLQPAKPACCECCPSAPLDPSVVANAKARPRQTPPSPSAPQLRAARAEAELHYTPGQCG